MLDFHTVNYMKSFRALLRGFDIAKAAHDSIKQKRKYTGEPYWTHCYNVGLILLEHFESKLSHTEVDESLVSALLAASCHDYAEDVTPRNSYYSINKLRELIGEEATNLVIELTDVYTHENYPNLNRAKRKELERDRIAKISNTAKNIKLADLIDNTNSIVEHDKDFARVYLHEKWQILKVLWRGSDKYLWLKTFEVLLKAKWQLWKFDIRNKWSRIKA